MIKESVKMKEKGFCTFLMAFNDTNDFILVEGSEFSSLNQTLRWIFGFTS